MQNFDIFRIDGHALRVFVTVCETGSVSRTAEIFGVNQSTISHTLDKMRNAIGDPLFVKSGRGITATEKSLALLPRVQEIVSDLEGLVAAEAYDISKDLRPVRVAIPTPALLLDMKSISLKLHEISDKIRLEIKRLAPRNQLEQLLSSDQAELAISVSGYKYPPTINRCNYGHDELVIFYDPKHRGPITTEEEYAAARHGVVDFGGNIKSQVEVALTELGLRREVALVAPTASMLGDFIRGTSLIATMPRELSNATFRGLAFCTPPIELPPIAYDLAWHRKNEASGRNTWLRKLVLSSRQGGTLERFTASPHP